jgi:hypothetical protein
MHVIVDPNSVDLMSASRQASVRASNRLGFQKRVVEPAVPTQPVTHDKMAFIWLILGAFSGIASGATASKWTVAGPKSSQRAARNSPVHRTPLSRPLINQDLRVFIES